MNNELEQLKEAVGTRNITINEALEKAFELGYLQAKDDNKLTTLT